MRRLESEEERERKKKRTNMIFGAFMLFVLVFGTVGFAFSFHQPVVDNSGNHGGEFDDSGTGGVYQSGDRWYLQLANSVVGFSNSPEDSAKLDVEIDKTLSDYNGVNVYIDSEEDEVYSQLSNVFGLYAERLQRACYGACEENLPEKTCSDNLIVLRPGNNRVYQEENCIFIEGDAIASDAFLYRLLGVN